MKLEKIIKELNKFAPPYLAYKWDKIGLQLGSKAQKVSKILVVLTVNEDTVHDAIKNKVDLIVSHHPLIFNPVERLVDEHPQEKWIRDLIKNDIAVFVMHTNLDIVPGGVSDALAEYAGLDMQSLKILSQTTYEKLFKLKTFVPLEHVEKVMNAIFEAGAGHIGNYSECSFVTSGKGSFKPLDGTNPFIGKKGQRESVDEYKLETIVKESDLNSVINVLFKAHPYEEVAYDVYELTMKGQRYGLGRWGKLSKSEKIDELSKKLGAVIKGKYVQKIKTLAVSPGSGADFIRKSSEIGVDCLVTGDIKYHDHELAKSLGICVLDMGHYESEKCVLPVLKKHLDGLFSDKVGVIIGEE